SHDCLPSSKGIVLFRSCCSSRSISRQSASVSVRSVAGEMSIFPNLPLLCQISPTYIVYVVVPADSCETAPRTDLVVTARSGPKGFPARTYRKAYGSPHKFPPAEPGLQQEGKAKEAL